MAEKASAKEGINRGTNRRRPFNEDEQHIVDRVLDLFSRAFARNEYILSTDEPSTSEAGPSEVGPSETRTSEAGPSETRTSEAGPWHCSLSEKWGRFDNAYRQAVSSIRGLGPSGNSPIAGMKRKGSSGPYAKKAKLSSWTHRFVCLSSTEDTRVPTAHLAREMLNRSGLGERKVHIPDVNCSPEVFHNILYDAFPKLKKSGGFELLRCIPQTRDLELIPSPICHSPRLLRNRLGTARAYIRPIQVDLDTEGMDFGENITEVKETCLKCHEKFPIQYLRLHVADCKGKEISSDSEDDLPSFLPFLRRGLSPLPITSTPTGSPISQPVLNQDEKFTASSSALPPDSDVTSSSAVPSTSDVTSSSAVPSTSDVTSSSALPPTSDVNGSSALPPTSDVNGSSALPPTSDVNGSSALPLTSDVNGSSALPLTSDVNGSSVMPSTSDVNSSVTFMHRENAHPGIFSSLSEVVLHVSSLMQEDVFQLTVRRSDVLGSTLCGISRRSFSPNKMLVVKFLGEAGQDGGGLRREFFRLLARNIKSSFFIGRNNSYVLKHDTIALQSNKFEKIGVLMSMALGQDGTGFPFLAGCMYQYISGKEIKDIEVDIEEVPDYEVYQFLTKIQEIDDDASLRDIVMADLDLLLSTGFNKPVMMLTLADKGDIIRVVLLHYTVLHCIAELDQLKKGLSSLGVLQIINQNPSIMAPFFVCSPDDGRLTAEKVQNLFDNIFFSEMGSNDREKEEDTYMYFTHLLNECEDNVDPDQLKLEEVVIFFSGSDVIPPLGFSPSPSISFNKDATYPSSSTCSMNLILPTKHNDYDTFKKFVTFAFQEHGGFGEV